MWRIKLIRVVFFSVFAVGFNSALTVAQTIPDSTLGNESSTVTPQAIDNNIADLIEGGAIRDSNLFHSFEEFNVSEGKAVYFANPDGIANILTRVTGNNLSQISGTLGVKGGANLFLLNPNGIVFSENAALDLNGSFFATTADSYVFKNDFAYSASSPVAPPLLAVDIPVGVQFGAKSEPIINRSQVFNKSDFSGGLQVTPENNITLLGGNILFENGHLQASSGQIEIGSVASNSFVALKALDSNWTLDYAEVTGWKNIKLSQESSLNGSGRIQLRGKQIRLLDGSDIYVLNFSDRNDRTIAISATELVELRGGEKGQHVSSLIQSAAFGEAKEGSVTIETDVLRLASGGQIRTGALDAGNSGDLSILAREIEITGTSTDGFSSGLFTSVGYSALAKRMGGKLKIETDNLYLGDRAIIGAGTFGAGNSGDIQIEARQVLVDGATIGSSSFGRGDSGNITIDTQELKVIGEASQVETTNFGSGQAGNLIIKASDSVEIKGFSLLPSLQTESEVPRIVSGDLFASIKPKAAGIVSNGLFTSVKPEAVGDGGNLMIETDRLLVSEGGKIAANTLGIGNAGDITIRANTIEVQDTITDFAGQRSGINSNVEVSGTGDGGNLNIYTNSLEITRGGSIAVDSKGQGNAGNINLEAKSVDLSGASPAQMVADLEQPSLPSQISAFAQGNFDAGSIAIATERLNISDRAEILASNIGRGNSGNIEIVAQDLSITDSGKLSAEVNGGEQGNIALTTENLFLSQNSTISARAEEESTGGNISIVNDGNIVLLDRSQIVANAVQGDGGEIDITTQGYFVAADSLVSASSQFGLDGNINIETINGDRPIELEQLPENLTDLSQKITQTCGTKDNKLAIAGKGGLPENPGQSLRGQALWHDLRLPTIKSNSTAERSLSQQSQPVLREANSWQITPQGRVQLLARYSSASQWDRDLDCAKLTTK